MWILRKVQESAESLPIEISQLVGKNSMEISAKADLLKKIHNNVLTPDKIPDFFLPPRICRRSLVAAEGIVSQYLGETNISQKCLPKPNLTSVMKNDNNKKGTKVAAKAIAISVKSYESGLSESPNTRRKESLFHSTFSSYKLERMTTRPVPKLPSIALLKVGSLESDTNSSADSSPHNSPPPVRHKHDTGALARSVSKEFLVSLGSKNTDDKAQRRALTRANHMTSTLAPPLQFPLDMLHCQKRVHSEHVLLLSHRGCIRLSASRSSVAGDLATIRIRVVSVEDLREASDPRPLHCGLTLSLSPGKLQRQHSATIRNCRNPVFNEDFFFTEPEGEDRGLQDFSLRVKVLEKNSGLGRATVLGVIVKPLAELLAS